eukprot:Gb_33330 [translate_table: standard]
MDIMFYEDEVDYSEDPLADLQIFSSGSGRHNTCLEEDLVRRKLSNLGDVVRPDPRWSVDIRHQSASSVVQEDRSGMSLKSHLVDCGSNFNDLVLGNHRRQDPKGKQVFRSEMLQAGGPVDPQEKFHDPLLEVTWGAQESSSERSSELNIQKRGVVSESEAAKGKKCIKRKRSSARLVLGDDIWMHEVVEPSAQALVSIFHGRNIGKQALESWLKEVWDPIFSYTPGFFLLSRGWLAFLFRNKLDAEKVVNGRWKRGPTPLSLKNWSPFFDTRRERSNSVPIWVKASSPTIGLLVIRSLQGYRKYSGFLSRDRAGVRGLKFLISGKNLGLEVQGFQRDLNVTKLSSGILPPVDNPINPDSPSLMETQVIIYSKLESKENLSSQFLHSQALVDGLNKPVKIIRREDSASRAEKEGSIQFFPKDIHPSSDKPCFIESQEEVLVISESKRKSTSQPLHPQATGKSFADSPSAFHQIFYCKSLALEEWPPLVVDGKATALASQEVQEEGFFSGNLSSNGTVSTCSLEVNPRVSKFREWKEVKLGSCSIEGKERNSNRGLGSTSRKQTLGRLVDVHKPDVLFLQETLGEGLGLVRELKKFLKEWDFIALDAVGHSGGLILSWRRRAFQCTNSMSFESGLGAVLFSQELESASIQFAANLKRLKQVAADWTHRKKLKDDQELVSIEDDLEVLYRDCLAGFPDEETKSKVKNLEHKRRKLLEEMEYCWRLKRRALWLSKGDKDTKFFHQFANFRKNVNTIWKIHCLNGTVATGFDELSQLGVDHFKVLYKEENKTTIAEVVKMSSFFPSFVGEEDNVSLTKEITVDELQGVMVSLQKDKSPGPNGWTVEFLLGCFYFIETDLLRVIEESRSLAKMLFAFNSTFIALIPKTDNPESFEDFRPISLCNCIYKILAKIIAMRIKKVLSNSISKEQLGFLQGRQIHEAVGVAREGLHTIKTKRLKALVVSVFILPSRGLRQGCPLSPLLFLLVAEGLSRALGEAKRSGQLKGIKIGGSTYLTHLLFVDDILLFCEGTRRDVMKLKEVLNRYCTVTGMIDLNAGFKYLGFVLKPNAYGVKSLEMAHCKGVLEKIRKLSFRFLWSGNSENESIPLVKWQTIATPKSLGGWWLKNIHLFGKALAAKGVWRLISSKGLWRQVLAQKYIAPDSIKDWIRSPSKKLHCVSIVWKVIVLAFPLVRKWLVWSVGNENRMRIGVDPWAGCGGVFRLYENLVNSLHGKGIYFLHQAADPILTSEWNQEWKTAAVLDLRGKEEEWKLYIGTLRRSYVRIKDKGDVLLWSKNLEGGIYTPKLGYKFLCEGVVMEEPQWVLTWDVLQKRNKHRPSRCPLCKVEEESINHLLLFCDFTCQVWKEMEGLLGKSLVWTGESIESSLRPWCLNPALERLWDKWSKSRLINMLLGLNLMGPPSEILPVVGLGEFSSLNDSHLFKFKAGLEIGTNNYAELLALKLLLKLATDKEVRSLQVFGDSLVIIKWMQGRRRVENILLRLIYDEVQAIKTLFNRITFHHVYRERNCEANSISKVGLHLVSGPWQVQEQKENHFIDYLQTSFY